MSGHVRKMIRMSLGGLIILPLVQSNHTSIDISSP